MTYHRKEKCPACGNPVYPGYTIPNCPLNATREELLCEECGLAEEKEAEQAAQDQVSNE